MRVATYTRISTDEAHQPYSLVAQAERLAAYIASQDGWTLVREYSDQKSGATLDRPGLRQALREAQAGTVRPAAGLSRGSARPLHPRPRPRVGGT